MGKLVKARNYCVDYIRRVNELETDIHVGMPACSVEQAVKYDRTLKAVWDTGAQGTSISFALANEMQLVQTAEIILNGVTGSCSCRVFLISLFLPNDIVIPELQVSECPGDIGCDVLIGMDIITMGDFAISHRHGHTVFSYRIPSIERIDFTTPDTYGKSAVHYIKPDSDILCPCGSGRKYADCCFSNREE